MGSLGGNISAGVGVAIVGIFAVWQLGKGIRDVTDSVGITVPDLGPPTTLTQSARGREADMIRAGYLVRLTDGSTQITDAGEEYIERQRQLQDTRLQAQIVFR